MKRYIRSTTITSENAFDTSTTGTSYYDTFLTDDGLDYMQTHKNLTGEIVWGTPREYFEQCADMFHSTVSKLIRERTDGREQEYAEMVESGTKFHLPYIYAEDQAQEGLHRMLAAATAYGWDCKVPWLEVKPYDMDVYNEWKKAQAAEEYFKYDFDDVIDDAVAKITDWSQPAPDNITEIFTKALEEAASNRGHDIEVEVEPKDIDGHIRLDVYLLSYEGYNIPVGQASRKSPWLEDMFDVPSDSSNSEEDLDIDGFIGNLSLDELELDFS